MLRSADGIIDTSGVLSGVYEPCNQNQKHCLCLSSSLGSQARLIRATTQNNRNPNCDLIGNDEEDVVKLFFGYLQQIQLYCLIMFW
ncbi:hypothetical protein M8J75_003558 [Diaphorina citri]|nr:hypothetical protein M8J75_003558 [Diaphorina citri]